MALVRTRVLLAEADPRTRGYLTRKLREGGYTVDVASDASTAVEKAAVELPDVVLVDLELPGTDGDSLLLDLREQTSVPILVLTSEASPEDAARALDLGADDHVLKPPHPVEMLARVRTLLRRAPRGERRVTGRVLRCGDIEIDLEARSVVRNREPVHLTPIEWGVLGELARSPGRVVSYTHLLDKVWERDYDTTTDNARTVVKQLRRKLEKDPHNPVHITTENGAGYRLCPPSSGAAGAGRPTGGERRDRGLGLYH